MLHGSGPETKAAQRLWQLRLQVQLVKAELEMGVPLSLTISPTSKSIDL